MSKLMIPTLLACWLMCAGCSSTVTPPQTNIQSTISSFEDIQLTLSKLATLSNKVFLYQPNQHEFSVLGDFNKSLVEVAYVLKNSAESFLCITGKYNEFEQNFSAHSNLGYARAINIKNQLIFWGAPSNKIEIVSVENLGKEANNLLIEGVNIKIEHENNNPIFSPLNLYFKANKYKIKLTDPIEEYFTNLKLFLDENPDKNVYVIGHSYEGENQAWNERISRYRATEVEKLMSKMGIDKNRIEKTYKGKSELRFDENSEDKLKNRRVEIRIK